MNKRHTKILNIVSEKKKISVAELAGVVKVSEVTVRKDLSQLEQAGLIKREHGFAKLMSADDISNRLSFNYELKKKIAKLAVSEVKDGETIMIESGSCCALLAEEVVTNRRDVTIITNSAFIANFVRDKGAHIILLGGEFQNEPQVMVGPLVKKCVENFFVNKIFIGTDGFNERGAMSADMMRAEAVRDMVANAQQTIILTESKKFTQMSVVPLLNFEKIFAIYTDSKIEKSALEKIETKGVKIYTVGESEF